jgi:hypothetical protein
VVIDGKVVKCSPAILKQEVKLQPTDTKKSKPFTSNQSSECVLTPNKTSKETKGKKSHQLKSINLQEECCPEDEATKESSDGSSFDKSSRGNFESPLAYHGYNGQQANSYSEQIKLSESPYSFFQQSYQYQFFPAEIIPQSSLPFMFRSSMPLQNYVAKPRPEGVKSNVPVDLVTASTSWCQPAKGEFMTPTSQTKQKKQSYYKMF